MGQSNSKYHDVFSEQASQEVQENNNVSPVISFAGEDEEVDGSIDAVFREPVFVHQNDDNNKNSNFVNPKEFLFVVVFCVGFVLGRLTNGTPPPPTTTIQDNSNNNNNKNFNFTTDGCICNDSSRNGTAEEMNNSNIDSENNNKDSNNNSGNIFSDEGEDEDENENEVEPITTEMGIIINSTINDAVDNNNVNNKCGCDDDTMACTTDSYVWNKLAVDIYTGEGYTCGDRIEWLQSIEGGSYNEKDACVHVAGYQFPETCGPACNPYLCNKKYVAHPNPKTLIWYDEFYNTNTNTKRQQPDPTKWTYDIGTGINNDGWGNNEQQYYTNSIDNVYIENDILHIRAIKEDNTNNNYYNRQYTSGRLVTRNLQDFNSSDTRISVKARLSNCTARGTWPAIWMLPTTNSIYGIWPNSGEIDIMEHVGYDAGMVHGSVHTKRYNHMLNTQKSSSINLLSSSTSGKREGINDWHVYEIIWKENSIQFIVDNLIFYEYNKRNTNNGYASDYEEWPFDQNFYLLLNVAVGGSWGGVRGIDTSLFEKSNIDDNEGGQIMEIDWVRVYSL